MKLISFVLAALFTCVCLNGCSAEGPATVPRPAEQKSVEKPVEKVVEKPAPEPRIIEVVKAIYYTDLIWYFPHTKDNFARNLAGFLRDHPDVEISAMVGDGTGSQGGDVGYFVILRKKIGESHEQVGK